jgi:hypothetical protein
MREASLPLTALSEAQRAQALERFTIIRPALEKEALPAGVARSGPLVLLAADRSRLARLPVCLPSARAAATASPPVRASDHRAQRILAAQEEGLKSGGALVLALTAVLHASKKSLRERRSPCVAQGHLVRSWACCVNTY